MAPGVHRLRRVAFVAAAWERVGAARRGGSAAKDGTEDDAVLFGIVAGVLAWIVLRFCARVLLDVVDATYVCYASDLDGLVDELIEGDRVP